MSSSNDFGHLRTGRQSSETWQSPFTYSSCLTAFHIVLPVAIYNSNALKGLLLTPTPKQSVENEQPECISTAESGNTNLTENANVED